MKALVFKPLAVGEGYVVCFADKVVSENELLASRNYVVVSLFDSLSTKSFRIVCENRDIAYYIVKMIRFDLKNAKKYSTKRPRSLYGKIIQGKFNLLISVNDIGEDKYRSFLVFRKVYNYKEILKRVPF